MDITESIDVVFEEKKRGIIRAIPYKYTRDGKDYTIDLTDFDVNNKYKVYSENGQKKIRIGDKDKYITGPVSYKINYTVSKAIIDYDSYQEVYWNVTGNEWTNTINNASFAIDFPKDLNLKFGEVLTTSGMGPNTSEAQQVSPRTVVGKSLQRITPGNGLTIAVKLPQGYLDPLNQKVSNGPLSNDMPDQNPWLALIPVAFFAFVFQFWKKLRGKHTVQKSDEKLPYPPEGLTSAHVGAFIDDVTHTRDIVSLIPYWAAEGFVTLEGSGDLMIIHRIKDLPDAFPNYEHKIFNKLFEDSETANLSSIHNKFYPILSSAKKMLNKEIKEQDYYDADYLRWMSWKNVLLVSAVFLILAFVSFIAFQQVFLGGLFILACIATLILKAMKKPLSEKGARLRSELKAFERFIKNPESEVLSNMIKNDPKYFDRMLPFAVAFGVEEAFMKKTEPYMTYAPAWYLFHNNSNRTFTDFSSSFQPKEINSAFSSVPASSSGSSGGFSSGGGFGGGGGSSW